VGMGKDGTEGEAMSTTSRGKAFENFTAKQLEEAGYHIAFKSIRVRFGAIDLDGVWDILAMKRNSPTEVVWLFVQCKSRRLYGKEKVVLINWMKQWGFLGINCAIAVKTKKKRKVGIEWHMLNNVPPPPSGYL